MDKPVREPRWFLATTKHMQEFLAAEELRNQGYVVYLPRTYWKVAGAIAAALRYPGYIFILFDPAFDEHGPINNTRGVDELMVDAQGRPRRLVEIRVKDPDGQVRRRIDLVEAIRNMEDKEFAAAISMRKVARDDLAVGQWVKIDNPDHVADGQEGEILKIEKKAVHVLVGFAMVWEIPDADVKKADRPKRRAA